MTKQEEFLYVVQTVVTANVSNLLSVEATRAKYSSVFSPDGVFVAMAEAIRASKTIPEHLSVADAAHEFCTYILHNLRDEEEAGLGHQMQAPDWLGQHGD